MGVKFCQQAQLHSQFQKTGVIFMPEEKRKFSMAC